MRKRFFNTFFVAALVALPSLALQAQDVGGSVIRYAEPGVITKNVYVWGDARAGRYIVPTEIDLLELLSIAGGPSLSEGDWRVRRRVTIRISRNSPEGRRIFYEANLADLIMEGHNYPTLQDGDIVSVETRTRLRMTFREVAQIIGSAASLALLAERVIRLTSN